MSYMLSSLTVNTDKVVLSNDKATMYLNLKRWLISNAKSEKPVRVTLNKNSNVYVNESKYTRVIGVQNIAVLNVGEMFHFFSNSVQKNYFATIPQEYKDEFVSIVSKWFGRVEAFGLIDQNNQLWRLDTQTNKQAQDGLYVCVREGHENEIIRAMGFNVRKGEAYSLDGQNVSALRKIKGQTMSAACKFSDKGLAPVHVENVRVFDSFTHSFNVKRVVEFDKEGKSNDFHYAEVTTRPCDAVFYMVRETMYYMALVELGWDKEAAKFNAINNGHDPKALELVEKWSKKGVQGRGPAMKFFGVDVPLLKWAKEIWAAEGKSGNPTMKLSDGTDFELTLENLLEKEVFALASIDVMKYTMKDSKGKKYVPTEYFTEYSKRVEKELGRKESSELEVVGLTTENCEVTEDGKKKYIDLKETCTLSRQLTSAYYFNSDESVEGLCARTLQELEKTTAETKEKFEALELAKSVVGKMVMEDEYQAARNRALFSKVRVKGTFAFAITEVRPILAKLLGCDDYMKHAKLHGARCYFEARAELKFCVDHRFPSLNGSSMPMEILSNDDSREYCATVQVLSLDSLFNDKLKGDYDGDTPFVALPENKRAGEYFLRNYDLAWQYLPDGKDNMTCEAVVELMRKQRTVSMTELNARMARM